MKIRNNDLEEQTRKTIVEYFNNNVQSYESGNSLAIMKIIMQLNDKTKLFQDAESPYVGYNNFPKETEFVLHSPENKLLWRIECKKQETYSNLISRLYDELDYIVKLPENKICFIVEGVLSKPKILLKFIKKVKAMKLEDKVWIGNSIEFERLLQKQIAA